jgi:hypothetical protein
MRRVDDLLNSHWEIVSEEVWNYCRIWGDHEVHADICFLPWRWERYIPSKRCWTCVELHRFTTHEVIPFPNYYYHHLETNLKRPQANRLVLRPEFPMKKGISNGAQDSSRLSKHVTLYRLILCKVWGPHTGGYEELYLLRHNTIQYLASDPTFPSNISLTNLSQLHACACFRKFLWHFFLLALIDSTWSQVFI